MRSLLLVGLVSLIPAAAAYPDGPSARVATSTSTSSADTLRVSPDAGAAPVAAAVEGAPAHAVVVLGAGVYREPTVVVDRPLTILGEPGAVLDGDGKRQLIHVRADSVTIRGLELRNVGTSYVEDRAAIKVEDARFCRIQDNRILDAFFGIYLANVGDCLVQANELAASESRETAAGNGIHLWYSTRITIRGNEVRGHRDGIYFEFVEDSRIEDNLSRGNLRYGLHFMFSDGCEYRHNVFRDNGAGVAVMYTEDVVMEDNLFDHNWGSASFGLLLKDIRDSRVVNNVFRRNSVGIYAEASNRMVVRDNVFTDNGWAVKIMANSEDNLFTRNDFVGNTFDVATNSRHAFSTFRENYWDAYEGYDLDRDGIGDVPFRPVRLFSFLVERNEPALVLLRSLFVDLLDAAERVIPSLTPETLMDRRPLMERTS